MREAVDRRVARLRRAIVEDVVVVVVHVLGMLGGVLALVRA